MCDMGTLPPQPGARPLTDCMWTPHGGATAAPPGHCTAPGQRTLCSYQIIFDMS